MNNIVLSIMILTFNRADLLKETLSSIYNQIDLDIEILIVDGNSVDHTESVVNFYIQQTPDDLKQNFKYIKLTDNGGFDKDLDYGVNFASGKYVWLFSDDDLFYPYAINEIKSVLNNDQNHDLDIVVVNSDFYNSDYSNILEYSRLKVKHDLLFSKDNIQDFYEKTGYYLSFFAAIIIKRDFWLQSDSSKHYGSMFAHLYKIANSFITLNNAYILSKSLIKYRHGVSLWVPRAFDIWMNKWPNLLYSCDGILPKTQNLIYSNSFFNELKMFLYHLSIGDKKDKTIREFIVKHGILKKTILNIFVSAPVNILLFLLLFYLFMDRTKSDVVRFDLLTSKNIIPFIVKLFLPFTSNDLKNSILKYYHKT